MNDFKWLLLVLLVLAIPICYFYDSYLEKEEEIRQLQVIEHNFDDLSSKINTDADISDMQKLLSVVDKLSLSSEDDIESVLKLKMALLSINNAEAYIEKANELFAVLAKNDPRLHPMNSPLVRVLVHNAISLYGESKNYIDSIKYVGSNEFNYSLNYTKGCIYFRYLQLTSTGEEAAEVFSTALNSFIDALKYKDKDINSQINIELLLKKQDEMMRNASKPKEERLKELPQPLIGSGTSKGKF